MKTQMRVQKILMLVSLVVSALVFVYALFFMTGGLANVYRFIEDDTDYIHCARFVSTSQSFVSTLVAFGIAMIVLVALMYLMACNSRRKYYITNYIAIGLFVGFALFVAIYLVVMVASIMNLYQHDILWKSGEGEEVMRIIEVLDETGKFDHYEYPMVATNYADQAEFIPSYVLDPNQTYNFIIGFVLFVIVIADAVCVTLCTVWKAFLIKGENKLLADGAPVTENAVEPVTEETAAPVAENVPQEAQSADPVKEEK
ncbi:MAG: hypothetical protein K2N14_03020 [Clostridia bacterium]|nr:hypothetical protein [Clostridia bacterium]